MDIEESFETEHLFLTERTCRVCGEIKDLTDGFYKTRKNRYDLLSSYSYECKACTISRITKQRKIKYPANKWEYPDW